MTNADRLWFGIRHLSKLSCTTQPLLKPSRGGSDGKEFTCNAGDLGSVPGLGISPGEEHSNPLQYSCLENPHEQKSLAGCSPWGHKEADVTERLSTRNTQYFIVCECVYAYICIYAYMC